MVETELDVEATVPGVDRVNVVVSSHGLISVPFECLGEMAGQREVSFAS